MTYHVQFPGLGLEFTLDRVAFTVFGMPIYWYGILIATGLALAIVFAFSHARRFGIDSDRMVDVILIGTVCAVIGGRAFYVATAPFEYASFAEMLDIRLAASPFTVRSSRRSSAVILPAGGARSPFCRCSIWRAWVFCWGRASAAGETLSTRRRSAPTPRCPGACTAKAPAITSQACRKRWPRRALRWTRPCRCTLRFCMNPSGACWAFSCCGHI